MSSPQKSPPCSGRTNTTRQSPICASAPKRICSRKDDVRKKLPANVFDGSEAEYNLEVARKNGMDKSAIALMRALRSSMERMEKNKPPAAAQLVRERDILRDYLNDVAAGKIVWQPGMANELRGARSDLKWLETDGKTTKLCMNLLLYLVLPAAAIAIGALVFSGMEINPVVAAKNFSDSKFFNVIKWVLYIVCGLAGLAAGGAGAILGLFVAWGLSKVIETTARGVLTALPLVLCVMAVIGLIAYWNWQSGGSKVRHNNRRVDRLRSLRRHILALTRD
ncbi:MAG: hypothetical protein K2H64_12310 [Desulfovibrio sp.]|nr:hypothetical protein [Desulfovibrio sp.]